MKQYPKSKNGLIFGLLLCMPMAANAVIVNGYGAEASAGTASNCPSFCTSGGGGQFDSDSDGGEFSNTAFAEVDSTYGALGRAQSSLTGGTYLPELRALASSDPGRRGSATAFAIQGYTYSGASSTTITLDLNLDGSITNNTNGAYTRNVLRADVAVLLGSSLDWYADFGTLVYEVAGATTTRAGLETLFLTDPAINQETGSITFDIDPGDDFYVVASMGASGQNGIADAWNTLTLNFDDDTGLTAASISNVPLPAAVWLFGSGLLGLIGISRRKKAA